MKHIQAPNDWYMPDRYHFGVFLAGGISSCPNWQQDAVQQLTACGNDRMAIINPRRNEFDLSDPKAATRQIEWEFYHLNCSAVIMFWFPCETLCPITLFEYGKWFLSSKYVLVGCHPSYQRRWDIIVQTKLEKPHFKPYDTLEETIDATIRLSTLFEGGL